MKLEFYTCDVFTDKAFGGNQLGYFPDADVLNDDQMQAITREFNFSECVFLKKTTVDGCIANARIFTPGYELPFAGHPTIGAAVMLAETGKINFTGSSAAFKLDEKAGVVDVVIHKDNDHYFATLTSPKVPTAERSGLTKKEWAELLMLPVSHIHHHHIPLICDAGVDYSFIELASKESVDKVEFDTSIWKRYLKGRKGSGFYVFAVDSFAKNVYARFFAPDLGISEDPATGSAAASLAAYLFEYYPTINQWNIDQGVKMGRASQIKLTYEVKKASLTQVFVGGSAVKMTHGELYI